MSLESIAEAVWTHPDRTLQEGVADPPTTRAEQIAAAVWTHHTRTLTGDAESLPNATFARAGVRSRYSAIVGFRDSHTAHAGIRPKFKGNPKLNP